jgi:hypothetical protein
VAEAAAEGASAFLTQDGSPQLARCAVLFVDLLGVRAMTGNTEAQAQLVRLERALRGTYRDFLEPNSPWPAAMFSDTLVVAAPVVRGEEESALGGLVLQASWLQLSLISAGFFVRGALTLGDFHILDGLLYGPALVEAYELETAVAIHPRIVLGETASLSLTRALDYYAEPEWAPQNTTLMRDDDGNVFINYLGILFDEPDDPLHAMSEHRDTIAEQLKRFRSTRRFWEKYRWVAEYHNAVCARYAPNAQQLLISSNEMTWGLRPFVPA